MTANGNPFNLGLKLEGQDAINFHEYLENPTCTPEGIELLRQAKELADKEENEIPQWLKKKLLNRLSDKKEELESERVIFAALNIEETIRTLEWVLSLKKED